eukprot:5705710-Pyramimonas_sp.AAC.1
MRPERRREELWAPKRKALPLQGLEDPSPGAPLTSPSEMAQAPRDQWTQVFASKSAPLDHLRTYLEKHVKPSDWSEVSPPTQEIILSER